MVAGGCDVTGLDIDSAAISTATARYPGLDFHVGDIYTADKAGYTAMVSFETLEHLDQPKWLIDSLPLTLTDIIASVPIRPTVGWNPWHQSDFTHGTFCRLIERQFTIIHVMSQPWVDGKGDLYLMVHGRRNAWA